MNSFKKHSTIENCSNVKNAYSRIFRGFYVLQSKRAKIYEWDGNVVGASWNNATWSFFNERDRAFHDTNTYIDVSVKKNEKI